MERHTAADALIDAGREVATVVGTERNRPRGSGPADPTGTLAVLTLLVLAAATVPIVGVALVGYVVTAARDPDRVVSGVDDWTAVAAAGARGTGLLVGAALPVAAALLGSGAIDVKAGSVVSGSAPGPILGGGIVVLAAAAWHVAVVGIAAVATGGGRDSVRGVRFGRSAEGIRLSVALAGLAGVAGAVGAGLTALPVVGPLLAAAVGAVGVAVAGRLVSRAVVESERGRSAVGSAASEDRLATPTDGSTRAQSTGSARAQSDGSAELRVGDSTGVQVGDATKETGA